MIEAPQRTERMLEASGRITPREVLEAYEETRLEAASGHYYDTVSGSACAIGVLLNSQGVWDRESNMWMDWDVAAGWLRERVPLNSGEYEDGFISGFDNYEEPDDPALHLGYRDGQRVRKFVLSRYPDLDSDSSED